jgi:CHASE3 domain sensor protein
MSFMITSVSKRTINIFLVIAIIILAIGSVVTFTQYQNLFRVNAAVDQSYRTIRAANQALISITESSLKVSNFLLGNDEGTISNLPETIIAAQLNLSVLGQLIQDDDNQKKAFATLLSIFNNKVSFLKEIISKYQAGDRPGALQVASDKNRLLQTSQLTQLIIVIKTIEQQQLQINNVRFNQEVVNANGLYAIFSMLSSILLVLCLFRLNGRNDTLARGDLS